MRRAAIISILLVLGIILLAGPGYEMIDRWDNIPQTGNDTVLSLVLLATCLGSLFIITSCTVAALKFLYRLTARLGGFNAILLRRIEPGLFELDSGPVSALFSLRI